MNGLSRLYRHQNIVNEVKIIQDGGQFVDLDENISRSKTDLKFFIRLLYIVFESLLNETIKILFPLPFKNVDKIEIDFVALITYLTTDFL